MSIEHWLCIIIPGLTYPLICFTYFVVLDQKQTEILKMLKGGKLDRYAKAYLDKDLIKKYFNWKTYILPIALNVLVVDFLVFGSLVRNGIIVIEKNHAFSFFYNLPDISIMGFAGAYLWTHYDMLRRFYVIDLNTIALHNMWLRILVCGVLACLFGLTLDYPVGMFTAFAIGTFPMHRLLRIVRAQIKHIKILDDTQKSESPNLYLIQGMTKNYVERFEEENIDSVEHLALANPTRLLLRTNIEWTVLLDFIDQAILINYIGEKINDIRHTGIRCAMELSDLKNDLKSANETKKENAEKLIDIIADKLQWKKESVINLIHTLYDDPQLNFIYDLWEEVFKKQ
jgi:hypothetical protein